MQFKKFEEPKRSNDFVSLKNDKDYVIGVLAGEPVDFMKAWQVGDKPKFRFHINIIVKEGPTFVPKILENGIALYRQLEELSSEYDLSSTYVKITRKGTGLDTEYSAIPSQKMKLSPEEIAHIKTLKLHDLKGKKTDSDFGGVFDKDEEVPF